MKKKILNPVKLSLKKITISTLNDIESSHMLGGVSGAGNASICPCIPPTEPEGCSNGCPSVNKTCATVMEKAQTQCCPTWVNPCSILIACIG